MEPNVNTAGWFQPLSRGFNCLQSRFPEYHFDIHTAHRDITPNHPNFSEGWLHDISLLSRNLFLVTAKSASGQVFASGVGGGNKVRAEQPEMM